MKTRTDYPEIQTPVAGVNLKLLEHIRRNNYQGSLRNGAIRVYDKTEVDFRIWDLTQKRAAKYK